MHLILMNRDIYKRGVINNFKTNSDLFSSIQELKVDFKNSEKNLLPCFIELFKNCLNVKKLTLNSSDEDSSKFLIEVLPFMMQLEEIQLSVELTEEKMQIIRENCPSIKNV